MSSQTPVITQLLLDAYSGRFMLSPRELEQVQRLEGYAVPPETLKAWVGEALGQRDARGERLHAGSVLRVVEQRAQQWRAQHVGEAYEREEATPARVGEALRQLKEQVSAARVDRATQQALPVFAWLESRLEELVAQHARQPHLDVSAALARLDEALEARARSQAPEDLVSHLEREVSGRLRAERGVARPQDVVVSSRALLWSLLRAELSLPPLYLNLYGGW
jgi:hypothetical protein